MPAMRDLRFTIALAVIALLTFFMPLVSAHLPVVGAMSWSGLNLIGIGGNPDQPAISDLGANPTTADSESGERPSAYLQVTTYMASTAPFVLLFGYALVITILAGSLSGRSPMRWLPTAAAVSGFYALLSVFLLADALYRSLRESMVDLEDNPFASLASAALGSVSIDPGLGLYVFCVVTVGIALLSDYNLSMRITRE